MTIGDKIGDQIISLLPVFGLKSHYNRVLDIFDTITRESLGIDINKPMPRFSVINSDGMPFEFSVSAGGSNGGLRLLTEIGIPGTSLPARINLTAQRLGNLLAQTGMKNAAEEINIAFSILLPSDAAELRGWRGGAWIAAGFLPDGRTGLRIYINGSDGEVQERWKRMLTLLVTLRDSGYARQMTDYYNLIRQYAVPMGTAIDILPDRIGKIKFYTRTFRSGDGLVPLLLNTSGLTSCKGHWDSFSRHLLIEQPDYPPGSLVISFEFPVGNSTDLDLKIDACSHCLFTTDMNAMKAILNLADSWRLDMDQYRTMLLTLSGGSVSGSSLDHHSFIGLGLSHGDGRRLNIYLKPSIKVFRKQQQNITVSSSERVKIKSSEVVFLSSKAPTDDDLGQAVSRAVSFIIDSQSPAGNWLDFNLPVGPSDAWVTAYTGLTLSHLPDHLITEGVRNSLKRAREWLRASMHSDFGWGYNAFTESDSDSTAYALLFLKEAGISVPDSSYKFLKSFQKENGGFATYLMEDTNNSWGISHGDVTPVVLEALLGNNDTEQSLIDTAHRFLLAQQDTSGPWHSFWWRSDLYCTMVNIRLFTRLGWRFRKGACLSSLGSVPLPDDPFELALLLRILTLLTDGQNRKIPNSELALLRLMNLQTSDGSWIADRILRLTSQNVKDPSFQGFAGDYYSDVCNTFTTSTVIESLISLMNERKAIKKGAHEPARSRINSRGT